jgi:hypothetical protein
MPREFSIALTSATFLNTFATQSPERKFWPLVEFLGYPVLYLKEMYSLYTYAQITGITVHHEMVNNGAIAVLCATGVCSYHDANSIDPLTLAESPGGETHILGGPGSGVTKYLRSYRTEEYLGTLSQTKDYWIKYGQAQSSSPVDKEEPCHVLACNGVNPGFGVVTYSTVTWHVQFFGLKLIT